MSSGRRSFLAGALAGIAAAGLHTRPAAARLSPAEPDPVMLLVDPGAPPAFMAAAAGILAASRLSIIDRRPGDGSDLAESVAWLAARPGRRIVGLLNDADAVLFDQLTRDGAIRCLSSAQHCESTSAYGQSRHRITALSSNAGLAGMLAAELAAAGTHFSVASVPLGMPRIAAPLPEIPARADRAGRGWEDTLGTVLAMIAAGSWPKLAPDVPGTFDGRGARGRWETLALRSFVFAS
nr:hypothetical protein [uncultured Rhodopila sp.]